MPLGLKSAEIEKIVDEDTLIVLCEKYDIIYEGSPHISGALALRELVIKCIVENNKRISRQLSSHH